MSHLKRPRIHFFGDFFTSPSTINNDPDAYNPTLALRPSWNPRGLHDFKLRRCTVRSALHDRGRATASSGDAIVGASVDTHDNPTMAKIVDLDPRWQSGSEIYGARLRLQVNGSTVIEGVMRPAFLRDLWFRRVPSRSHVPAAGGSFYAVIQQPTFGRLARSPTLSALKLAGTLTVKMVVYAFDTTTREGKVAGTIGAGPPEIGSGYAGRRLLALSRPGVVGRAHDHLGPFGSVDAHLDVARSRLTLDIGNAIPESAIGGSRINLGQLQAYAEVTSTGAGAPSRHALGPVDYSTSHARITAGVEELPLNAAQLAAARVGSLLLEDGRGSRTILTEDPSGLSAIVDPPIIRLQPGATGTARVVVHRRGQPAASVRLCAAVLVRGSSRPGGLTQPGGPTAPSSLTTNASGVATLRLRAGRPTPGPADYIDGETYEVNIYEGSTAAITNRLAATYVRVFDEIPAVASPRWADVRPILEQYQRLYPGMGARVGTIVAGHDLGDHATYQNSSYRTLTRVFLLYPREDPRHMPVTRDLSDAKRAMLIRWLDAGAP
ncbi:MAG: hypothetical protein AAF721_29405 [Myxococcota bacterium]